MANPQTVNNIRINKESRRHVPAWVNVNNPFKKKLLAWLLKDVQLGFDIANNSILSSTVSDNKIFLNTGGAPVTLNNVQLPDGFEIIIRKTQSITT